MRFPVSAAALLLSFPLLQLGAQLREQVPPDKTFLTRGDAAIGAAVLGSAALLSIWDVKIARASQKGRIEGTGFDKTTLRVSKVNESTLTLAGLVFYGAGRLTKQRTMADVALHATESVLLASVASQVIRGPLGRSRPYATLDSAGIDNKQYDFDFGGGFKRGEAGFRRRAFPSIHTSSSMAVATVLTMELKRRDVAATPYVAPLIMAAGLLPGLARIQLNQHWASDIFAGAAMGIFAGYKVVSYSHDHPTNGFDRRLLGANVMPSPQGISFGFTF